jgi:hypothetical protein
VPTLSAPGRASATSRVLCVVCAQIPLRVVAGDLFRTRQDHLAARDPAALVVEDVLCGVAVSGLGALAHALAGGVSVAVQWSSESGRL